MVYGVRCTVDAIALVTRVTGVGGDRVVNWVQCQDMISAANFSPDGQLTVAGLYDGRVMFYHTLGLRYYTQVRIGDAGGCKLRPSEG